MYMKTIEEFVSLFAEQFYNTDPLTIKADTMFHEVDGWSSLIALSIIAMVYEEFGVMLKGDDVRSAVTVEDLYELVKSKS